MVDVNPYNYPGFIPAKDGGDADFRTRAVAESERMGRGRSGFSSCLEREPSLAKFRTLLKVIAVVSVVLGLAGLAVGGGIVYLKKADEPYMLDIALGCSVAGILLMFLPTWSERWIAWRHLSPREAGSGAGHGGVCIGLENAETYDTLKLLADDVGLMFLHPEAQYIKISGLSYDYVIQAKDVTGLALHQNGKTVLLSYMVGNVRLDLAIIPRSLLAELKRQILGSSRSLFESIEEALGAPPIR